MGLRIVAHRALCLPNSNFFGLQLIFKSMHKNVVRHVPVAFLSNESNSSRSRTYATLGGGSGLRRLPV